MLLCSEAGLFLWGIMQYWSLCKQIAALQVSQIYDYSFSVCVFHFPNLMKESFIFNEYMCVLSFFFFSWSLFLWYTNSALAQDQLQSSFQHPKSLLSVFYFPSSFAFLSQILKSFSFSDRKDRTLSISVDCDVLSLFPFLDSISNNK